MANDRDLQLKIQAIIDGAKDVQQLKDLLRDLSQQQVKDNSKGFRAGLDRSSVAAKGLNVGLRTLTTGLGALGLAFSAVGIMRFVGQQLDLADQLNTTAKTIGINVETLQEYRFAAEEAGVSTGVLDSSIQRFMRRTAQAAQGTGAARTALQELNIQLRDASGQLRPVEELMDDVADAMAKIPNQADRNRLAFALFGREGVGMINMLEKGSQGLREHAEEARRLGLVLSTDTVSGAADAARELQKMRQTITAQFARVVVENADAFKDLAESVTEVAVAIAQFVSVRWSPLAKIQGEMDALMQKRDQLLDERRRPRLLRMKPWLGTEDLDREINEINDKLIELQKKRDDLQERRQEERRRDSSPGTGWDPEDVTDTSSTDKRQKQIQTIIDRLKEQAETYGMAAESVAIYRLELLGADEAQIKAAKTAAATVAVMRDQEEATRASAAAYDELEKEIEQNQQADAALLQSLEREIELLGMGNRERAIATATAKLSVDATDEQRQAIERLAGELFDLAEQTKATGDDMSEFAKQAARNIQSVFADFLFDPFDKGLKGMLRGFIEVIHRMISEALAAQVLQALFGSMGGVGGPIGSLFGTLAASVQHSGGLAGTGPKRNVSAGLFIGAQRYHTGGMAGLAPDEVPAILQRGEVVLSRRQVAQASQGANAASGKLQVELSDGLVGRLFRSDEGLSALIDVVQRHRSTFKGLLD